MTTPQSVVIDPTTLAPLVAGHLRDDVVADTVKAVLARLEALPAIQTAGIISQAGGTADPETKTFADWLLAVSRKDVKRLDAVYATKTLDANQNAIAVKAPLAEGSGTTGGYLVPPQQLNELLMVAAEESIVRSRAYIQPMASRTLQIPMLDQATAPSSGNSAFFGGVSASWTGEAGQLTETEPTFRMMNLVAHKLGGYTLASGEIMDDSAVALAKLLTTLFAKVIAWSEDYAFLRGNGVAKPLGIQNAPCAISVSRHNAGHFDLTDVANMLKRALPASVKKLVWVMHPFLIPELMTLQVGSATGANWLVNVRDDAPMTLMGYPIIFSEKMAALGSSFDVLLADFSYYVIGDRRALEVSDSPHFKFINDQITWRFTYRVDGQPWLNNPITLADTTNTVSPFVYLT